MTNARPNALSLAVAVAISSSIIGTQALADRTIRTRSVDIPSDGHEEFTQSEVTVKQTLDAHQRPVANSYTTTYPDQGPDRQDHQAPSDTFTDTLSGVDGGVSTVDTYRTGGDEAATGYTRLVKVGDESVFKITHDFDQQEIVIEVRQGMTDDASVAAVKGQLGGDEAVNDVSKMSNPGQLAGILKGAHARAGQLGGAEDFVELVKVEVEVVEVNGRKFLRSLTAGQDAPQLDDLSKTLYINDDVILTAATSAYTQVQVSGDDADLDSLNGLMTDQKPVGFVVRGQPGDQDQPPAQPLPYPGDYPTLEVTQGAGDQILIVHGQKVNPADVAFVIALTTDLDEEAGVAIPRASLPAYKQAIRSRQMQILDGFAKTLLDDPQTQFDDADITETMKHLAKFEFLHQAMISADPEAGDEFLLTSKHLGTAEVWMGPGLVNVWLRKFFSFRPSLRALLGNQVFIAKFTPAITEVAVEGTEDADFAKKVVAKMAKQLVEMEQDLKKLQDKEGQLAQLKQQLQRAEQRAKLSDEEKVRLRMQKQQVEDELAQARRNLEAKQLELEQAQAEAQRVPQLEQQVREARAAARKEQNNKTARELKIENWNDDLDPDQQDELIKTKIQEVFRAVAEAAQLKDETVKTKLAAIEGQLGIVPDNEDDLDARSQAIQQHLQQQADQLDHRSRVLAKEKLAAVEGQLGLVPDNEDDLDARAQAIQQHLQQQADQADQRSRALAKEKLAAVEGQLGLVPDNEDDLDARAQAIQQHLQQQGDQARVLAKQKLAAVEGQLGLVPDNEDDLDARSQAIQQHLQQQADQRSRALAKEKLAAVEGQLGLVPDNEDDLDARSQAIQQRLQQQGGQDRDLAKQKLAAVEGQLGLVPDNEDDLDARSQAIQQHLQQQQDQADQRSRVLAKEKLAAVEGQLGLVPDNEDDLDARSQAIQQHLQQQGAQADQQARAQAKEKLAAVEGQLGLVPDNEDDLDARSQAIQQHLQQQGARTDAEKTAAIKARYAAIAAQLNMQGFDDDADIDTQQERLLQKIQELNAQGGAPDDADVKANQGALAAVLDIQLDEDGTVNDRNAALEKAMQGKVDKLTALENDLEDARTPGHPRAKPEVLKKLSEVEDALEIDNLNPGDDEYLRRQIISDEMQKYIIEARQRSEEDAIEVLKTLEKKLDIEVADGNDREARLAKVREKLGGDVSEESLNEIEIALRDEDDEAEPQGNRDEKLQRLRDRLTADVEKIDERAREKQTELLEAAEDRLEIDIDENAEKRGKAFREGLAEQLEVEFDDDANLDDQKGALKGKIQELTDEVGQGFADEDVKRGRNNAIAQLLGIDGFDEDAEIDDQNTVLQEKLQQLDGDVDRAGVVSVKDRVSDIDSELDKHMARLAPKPEFALERDVATSRRALADAESKREAIHKQRLKVVGRAGVHPISDDEATAINQRMKQIQTELGLNPPDEQTTEERVDDIRQHLQGAGAGAGAGRGDEAVQKLKTAATDLKVPVEGGQDLLEEANAYLGAITAHAATHGVAEVEEVVGELPETRREYTRVTGFLREHDQKHLDFTNAENAEGNAQRDLDNKKQEITDLQGDDQQAKTRLENERDQIDLRLKQAQAAVPVARAALDAHDTALEAIEKDMDLDPGVGDDHEARINALRHKQTQLGGDDGNGGKIQRLTQVVIQLDGEAEAKDREVAGRNEALRAAQETLQNAGEPVQYTPKQKDLLIEMHAYMQHPLKNKALRAAIGLLEAAGKEKPYLIFDFDDEYAPIRLQSLIGKALSYDQARHIVEVFRELKTTFPGDPVAEVDPLTAYEEEEVQDRGLSALEEVQDLASRVLAEMKTGAQQYDDEVHGMRETAMNYVEADPRDLKDFSEYFATSSASGNKIIMLLRDGLISKVELENYMKAVKGVDGFDTVDEFEHFLGYKHGVNVAKFKAVVHLLSKDGADEFMQRAFAPVTVNASGPAGMKESVAGMKEYAASVIANYVLDDIAFENGRKTAAFLANVQETLTPYANAIGMSESELLKIINGTLMQAHSAAVEQQVVDFWVKPSAFLVQAVTWYFSSYKPLLTTNTAWQAAKLSFSNMSYLYLMDLTNRGDYLHRLPTPFQSWMERYGVDLDRTGQYAFHSRIEETVEVGGLAMPFGKAASSVILLKTGTMLFARQYNANPQMYRSISRLVPQIVRSMGSRQGIQVPLLHRMTPQKVKTLTSTTAGVVLGPVAVAGSYAYGLVSGFTYAQTFGVALAAGVSYDFFMNDNKMLTQWLGGPLGRGLDAIERWRGTGEAYDEHTKRTAVTTPQRYGESDEAYAKRVQESNMMHGWTRNESYLQFRERRDRTMKLFDQGWEKYFKENVPRWSFSHSESIPYSHTLGAFYEWQEGDDKEVPVHDERESQKPGFTPPPVGDDFEEDEQWDSSSKSTQKQTSTPASTVTSASSEVPVPSVSSSATQTTSEAVPVVTPTVDAPDLDEDEQWDTETTTQTPVSSATTTEAPVTTESTVTPSSSATTTEAPVTSDVVPEPSSSSVVQTTTTTESVVEPSTTSTTSESTPAVTLSVVLEKDKVTTTESVIQPTVTTSTQTSSEPASTVTTSSSVTPVISETPVATPDATSVPESTVTTPVSEPEATPPVSTDEFEEDEVWDTTTKAAPTTTTTAAPITPTTTTSTSTTTTTAPKETPAAMKPTQVDLDEFDLDEDWGDDEEDKHDEL
ncbi:MAG: hypothetical protein ACR2PX_24480 [Endozoicomonas sp.]|uniref:hypothetical protein n=1 Tax=Endozoicomonas sp. TaxID=1892382 RepID=UPI003D9BBC6C